MIDGQASTMVTVGVALPGDPGDVGEWLADGRAFEAAGAGALLIDLGADAELDALTLAAALAVVSARSLLVLPPDAERPAAARALATVGRLSHGRLRILADGTGADELRLCKPGEVEGVESDGVQDEVWLRVPSPDSRAAWRETVAAATGDGHVRLMVAASPRLLDILRNPEEPGDRLDLQLAMG